MLFEIVTDIIESVIDFFQGEEDNEPDICGTGECLESKEELNSTRSHFQNACHWLGLIKVSLVVPQWIVERSIIEMVFGLIVAIMIAGLMGAVVAIAVYFIALIFIRAMAPVLLVAGQNLVDAIVQENAAIARVIQECPEACRGNLNPSECIHAENELNLAGGETS